MPSVLYLAMTGAEFSENLPVFPHIAWMACHFSPYGTGLSNLPQILPAGSMLILNDRTPVMGHDPHLVSKQLCDAARELGCTRILLDLQRPGPETEAIVRAVLEEASCPAGVSELFAAGLDCPVFLPPVPLLTPFSEYLSPWSGREIWLEAALDTLQITVTPEGSRYLPCPVPTDPLPHRDVELDCHYGIIPGENRLDFVLHRTWDDLQNLLNNHSISCFVGLYQELKEHAVPNT